MKAAYFCDNCGKVFRKTALRKAKTTWESYSPGLGSCSGSVVKYLCHGCFNSYVRSQSGVSDESYARMWGLYTSWWGRHFGVSEGARFG